MNRTVALAARSGLGLVRWIGSPDALIRVGILLVVAGLGLIGYTWGRVAGVLFVPLQIPYVISGGITGLALVRVGGAVLKTGVERKDARARQQVENEVLELLRRQQDDTYSSSWSEAGR